MKSKIIARQALARALGGLGIAILVAVGWSFTVAAIPSAPTATPIASSTPSRDVMADSSSSSPASETPLLQVIVPAPMVVEAEGPWGAKVHFSAFASNGAQVTCRPNGDTDYSIGGTLVICTATDAAGNTSSASTSVIVQHSKAETPRLVSISPLASCYGHFEVCQDFTVRISFTGGFPIRAVYINYKFDCSDQDCPTATPTPLQTPTVIWPNKFGWMNRTAEQQTEGAAVGDWVVKIPRSEAEFLGKANGYLTIEIIAVDEGGLVGTLNPPDRWFIGYSATATPPEIPSHQ